MLISELFTIHYFLLSIEENLQTFKTLLKIQFKCYTISYTNNYLHCHWWYRSILILVVLLLIFRSQNDQPVLQTVRVSLWDLFLLAPAKNNYIRRKDPCVWQTPFPSQTSSLVITHAICELIISNALNFFNPNMSKFLGVCIIFSISHQCTVIDWNKEMFTNSKKKL